MITLCAGAPFQFWLFVLTIFIHALLLGSLYIDANRRKVEHKYGWLFFTALLGAPAAFAYYRLGPGVKLGIKDSLRTKETWRQGFFAFALFYASMVVNPIIWDDVTSEPLVAIICAAMLIPVFIFFTVWMAMLGYEKEQFFSSKNEVFDSY